MKRIPCFLEVFEDCNPHPILCARAEEKLYVIECQMLKFSLISLFIQIFYVYVELIKDDVGLVKVFK